MAVGLPKYKSQVQVSGKGTAQTIDPGLAIQAAGANDKLIGEVIEKAGGVASDFFQKKAESEDRAELAKLAKAQSELPSIIEKNKQDALFGRGNYEGNPLGLDDIYEQVTKPALEQFQESANNSTFNFGANKQKLDVSVNNFITRINQQEIINKNRIELEQSNHDRLQGAFQKEYDAQQMQDELDVLQLDPITNAEQIKSKQQQLDKIKTEYEAEFKDLERTTKPGAIDKQRSTFAYNTYTGLVRQAQLDLKNNDITITEYEERLEKLEKEIEDSDVIDVNLKRTLEAEIISKRTSANITYSRQVNTVESKLAEKAATVDGLQEIDFVDIKKLYGEELGNKLIDDAVAGQVSNLAIQLDKFPQTQKIINKFTESEDPQSFEEFVLEATEELGSKNGVLVRRLGRVLLREMLEENPTLSAEKVFGKAGKVKAGTKRETISIPYNGRAKQLFFDLLEAGNALDFLTKEDRQEWESKIEGGTLALVEMFSLAASPQDVTDEMIDAWRLKYEAPVAKKIARETSISNPMIKLPSNNKTVNWGDM